MTDQYDLVSIAQPYTDPWGAFWEFLGGHHPKTGKDL